MYQTGFNKKYKYVQKKIFSISFVIQHQLKQQVAPAKCIENLVRSTIEASLLLYLFR